MDVLAPAKREHRTLGGLLRAQIRVEEHREEALSFRLEGVRLDLIARAPKQRPVVFGVVAGGQPSGVLVDDAVGDLLQHDVQGGHVHGPTGADLLVGIEGAFHARGAGAGRDRALLQPGEQRLGLDLDLERRRACRGGLSRQEVALFGRQLLAWPEAVVLVALDDAVGARRVSGVGVPGPFGVVKVQRGLGPGLRVAVLREHGDLGRLRPVHDRLGHALRVDERLAGTFTLALRVVPGRLGRGGRQGRHAVLGERPEQAALRILRTDLERLRLGRLLSELALQLRIAGRGRVSVHALLERLARHVGLRGVGARAHHAFGLLAGVAGRHSSPPPD